MSETKRKFRTTDGYTFAWDSEAKIWTDGDLEFQADSEGNPIDDTGERLEGDYVD